jgi:hypothetical protein
VPCSPVVSRSTPRQAVTQGIPPSEHGQSSEDVGGCSNTKTAVTAHIPPTPLSDGPGMPDHNQNQPEPEFSIFDICTSADLHDPVSNLNEPEIFKPWPLIPNIDIDLDQWDHRLASPPNEPAGLTPAPHGSVLPPSSPAPASEVSQQQAGLALADLLGWQQARQVILGAAGPTTQLESSQKQLLAEVTVAPGRTGAHEAGSQQVECRCLQPVVFLIDELEVGRSTVAAQGLDAGLASHKEALRYGQALLDCQRCRARPEHMTILKFLADKLVGLSEQIVAEYARYLLGATGNAEELATTGVRASTSGANHLSFVRRDSSSGTCSVGRPPPPPWPAVLGSYEVDSAREWDTVIGSLIGLQLEALHSLVESMKAVSRAMRWDAMLARTTATQRRILPMTYQIQSLCRPGGGTVDATVSYGPG